MTRRGYDGLVVYCQECGRPWGVLGEGRHDDLLAAFDVWWAEHDPHAATARWHLGTVRSDVAHRLAQLDAPGQLTLPT